MFPAVTLALFAYSICKIEIQCSVIQRENLVADATDSTEVTKNLTLLKKIENALINNKSLNTSQVKIKKVNISIGEKKPQVNIESADIATAPLLKKENRALISNGKNLLPKDDVGPRQPKFLGPLAFLTGLGAASLATAASVNANAFVKIFSPAVPVPIGAPGYFTGFYEPPQYLPFSYPVLYPVPRLANNYVNFGNRIPLVPLPLTQQTTNVTVGKSPHENGTNSGTNDEANERPANEEAQQSREAVAVAVADQVDVKRTISSNVDDEKIELPAVTEETELRQANDEPQSTTTTTTTTTTEEPVTMSTSPPSNITVPLPSLINTTGSWPFYGYYGGSPQDVGHVILTTEDPQQRYLQDYHGDAFAVPFERPAVQFSPYQNVESYPSPFVHSFSAGEPYPEFLNTIESDRYAYDSENHRNLNGFRPILK